MVRAAAWDCSRVVRLGQLRRRSILAAGGGVSDRDHRLAFGAPVDRRGLRGADGAADPVAASTGAGAFGTCIVVAGAVSEGRQFGSGDLAGVAVVRGAGVLRGDVDAAGAY